MPFQVDSFQQNAFQPPAPVGSPGVLSIAGQSHHSVSLAWEDKVGLDDEWIIERSPAGAGTWAEIARASVAKGKAAQFTRANSEYLSIADNAALSMGGTDAAWAFWVRPDSAPPSIQWLLFKGQGTTGTTLEYAIRHTSAGALICSRSDGTTLRAFSVASQLTVNVWALIVMEFTVATGRFELFVNGVSVGSLTNAGEDIWNGAGSVFLGSRTGGTDPLDGRLDSVGIWKRTLTTAEKTWLYNGGAGRQYSEIGSGDGAALATNLQAWWNLEEASGTRSDSHGMNHLTDNNTVTQADGIADLSSFKTYDDLTALPSTSYDYRVRAANAGGYSPYSNTATAATTAAPATPSGRAVLRRGHSRVFFTLDDRPVDMADDWLAQTVANGGFGNATGRIPERVARRWPTAVDEGATLKGYLESGECIYEGDLDKRPSYNDGWAELAAQGAKSILEEKAERPYLFQDMSPEEWKDENSAPFDGGGSEHIQVRAEKGEIVFSTDRPPSTDEEHAVVRWVPNASLGRFRFTAEYVGDRTGFDLTLDKATGPDGARTNVNAFTFTGTTPESYDSGEITNPTDMLIFSLRYEAAAGGSGPFAVHIRLPRVNDLVSEDSMGISDGVRIIGRLAGLDVSGIPVVGIPIDSAVFSRRRTLQFVMPGGGALNLPGGNHPLRNLYGQQAVETFYVNTSGMNVLPLHRAEPGAQTLDDFALWMDWTWAVWESRSLHFSPWGPTWQAHGATMTLQDQPGADRVVVYYPGPSGEKLSAIAFPDRPNGKHPFVVELTDPQANADMASEIANRLRNEVSAERLTGGGDLPPWVGAGRRVSSYLVRAGSMLEPSGWRDAETPRLRISHTEMRKAGTRVGVEAPATVAAALAMASHHGRQRELGRIKSTRVPRVNVNVEV